VLAIIDIKKRKSIAFKANSFPPSNLLLWKTCVLRLSAGFNIVDILYPVYY